MADPRRNGVVRASRPSDRARRGGPSAVWLVLASALASALAYALIVTTTGFGGGRDDLEGRAIDVHGAVEGN